jgi:hypothetical protein
VPLVDAWLLLGNSTSPPEPIALGFEDHQIALEREVFARIVKEAREP